MALVNFDVIVAGRALEDLGLSAFNTISGLGLVTEGFLWECSAIWAPGDDAIVTTWVECSNPDANIETCS